MNGFALSALKSIVSVFFGVVLMVDQPRLVVVNSMSDRPFYLPPLNPSTCAVSLPLTGCNDCYASFAATPRRRER